MKEMPIASNSASSSSFNAWNFVQLRCNSCWEILISDDVTSASSQISYRTNCYHLFCEKCAYRHFGDGELICPACQTELSNTSGSICEIILKKRSDPQKLQNLWSEILSNPTAILIEIQHALDFIFLQLTQESFRQEQMRNAQEEDMKNYQSKYGERYMQLKSSNDKMEAQIEELRTKLSSLSTSNEELRQAFKEKARKSRNWEKLYKSMKAQIHANQAHISSNVSRQLMSPGMQNSSPKVSSFQMQHHSSISSTINQSPKFATSISRPMNRSETPITYARSISRPHSRPECVTGNRFLNCNKSMSESANSYMEKRFTKRPINSNRVLNRPKTPISTKKYPFIGKRPVFNL